MRLLSYSLLFFSLFLLDHTLGADVPPPIVVKSTDPPRPQGPLTSPHIEALPSYDTVNVATIHYEFDGAGSDVPQVQAELSAMQHIFLQYGFSVRDISIPKSSNAQSFLESQIQALYQGLSGPGSLAIIIYGGHGNRGGTWTA
jgi:hypothetical protein